MQYINVYPEKWKYNSSKTIFVEKIFQNTFITPKKN